MLKNHGAILDAVFVIFRYNLMVCNSSTSSPGSKSGGVGRETSAFMYAPPI